MQIAYANAAYHKGNASGANAHVFQFIKLATELGHEIWTWPGDEHPDSKRIPSGRLDRLMTIRKFDVLYVRTEHRPVGPSRWSLFPYRNLIGTPMIVWEFNTVPEYGLVLNESGSEIQSAKRRFTKFGSGCDLAFCVSELLSDYVRNELSIRDVVTIPNGSDPDIFRPNIEPVSRMSYFKDFLNVIWIGSAYLKWHNIDLLRDTAQILASDHAGVNIAFHIVGHGLGLMRDMPLNVYYHGPETYDVLPAWLSAMDIGLVLYHPGPGDYSSPLKMFDYMASGLAVVGTTQPQLDKVLNELNQESLTISSNDPQKLANLLIDLESDRDRVLFYGRAGRNLVIDHYNWNRAVADIFKEIEKRI